MANSFKRLVFWSKILLLKRQKANYYRHLLRNQQMSRDELEALNWRKRRDIVAYAYEHVPYYRRKYREAGVTPEDITSPEHFSRLPILTKEEIRTHAKDLVADDAHNSCMVESSTGGSTGVPVKVWHDTRFHFEPLLWRMLGWWGLSPEMNSAYVLRLRRKHIFERLVNAAMWWPTRRAFLDASLMTDTEMGIFVRRLVSLKPPLIQGYAGSVYHLALFIEEHGISVPSPKAVWVTSSPISRVQRLKMEKVFKAPVYDQYGCGEVFALAAQCAEQGGLHVFWDARFIEFVDFSSLPVHEGEYGSAVITDLENRVFPLIRYQNGDAGRFLGKTCSCGCELPLIDSIRGRATDCLTLPDGTKISGDYLTTLFDDFPDVVQAFQVRQLPDFSIRLLYIPAAPPLPTQQALLRVKRELEMRSQGQVEVILEKVGEIPHDRGKLRFVISDAKVEQTACGKSL